MRVWPLFVIPLACLALIGCRADPNTLLLERELRLQEDEIYRLRACLDEYRSTMEASGITGPTVSEPAETAAGQRAGTSDVPGTTRTRTSPRSRTAPPGAMPLPSLDIQPGQQYQEGEIPDILIPGSRSDKPEGTAPGPSGPELKEPDEPPRFHPISHSRTGDGRQAASLALNRPMCTGRDADGTPGDEGITVALEPRDARGRIVEVPGKVAVVVLDPALEGESARVARWDFSTAEVAGRFRNVGRRRAIQLDVLWPAAGPRHNDLHLFVRYTTADGRHLEADMPIRVALPGERPPRWVPTDPIAPAEEGEPSSDPDLRANTLTPRVRAPVGQSRRAISRPAAATPQRPVWSPERP